MRLRNVRGAREALEESDYTINVPEENKGRWHEIFGNDNEIHLEIGTGKGRFIMELASKNPDINYIGIEKFSSVLVRALEKQREMELPNLRFIRMDAEKIEDVFEMVRLKEYILISQTHGQRTVTRKDALLQDSFCQI